MSPSRGVFRVFLFIACVLNLYFVARMWQESHESSSPQIESDNSTAPIPALVFQEQVVQETRANQHMYTCELCILEPENSLCEYGVDSIRLSKGFSGSGYRVRRFFERALAGEKLRIGVIGGSVSLGHGCDWGAELWWHRAQKAMDKMFPDQIEWVNGARAAMDSHFFGWCLHTVTGGKQIDLYLAELDINNSVGTDTLIHDDTLYRSILDQKHMPALIRISAYALSFDNLMNGIYSSLVTSNHFDVPVLGIRNFLMPHSLYDPDDAKRFFGTNPWANNAPDYRHINELSHRALGDMLTIYFKEMLCETKRRQASPPSLPSADWPQPDELGAVPRLAVYDHFDSESRAESVEPFCMLPDSPFPLEPDETTGEWETIEWHDKKAFGTRDELAIAKFRVRGTRVAVVNWQQKGPEADGTVVGSAYCWIAHGPDESGQGSARIFVDGSRPWDVAGTGFYVIGEDLKHDEEHTLVCQTTRSKVKAQFRLVGVMTQ